MTGLAAKIVLITGASSGIGRSTALEFAKYGTKLVLTGRNKIALQDVTEQCLQAGAIRVHPIIAEMSRDADIEAIVRGTLDTFGTVNILVNNAGGGSKDDTVGITVTQGDTTGLDQLYNTMVRGSWKLTGLIVQELIRNKGCVVNVSSVFGVIPVPHSPGYGMMKAAMNYMTRLLATELGVHGVRVNGVMPGSTVTSGAEFMGLTIEESKQMYQRVAQKNHMLEQKACNPEDIAKAILFLCSDDAARITGINMPVDGGFLLASRTYGIGRKQESKPGKSKM